MNAVQYLGKSHLIVILLYNWDRKNSKILPWEKIQEWKNNTSWLRRLRNVNHLSSSSLWYSSLYRSTYSWPWNNDTTGVVYKGKGKGNDIAVSNQNHLITTPLREITCHMGSHSVICYPAAVTFSHLPQPKPVLYLVTPEGCKAELT